MDHVQTGHTKTILGRGVFLYCNALYQFKAHEQGGKFVMSKGSISISTALMCNLLHFQIKEKLYKHPALVNSNDKMLHKESADEWSKIREEMHSRKLVEFSESVALSWSFEATLEGAPLEDSKAKEYGSGVWKYTNTCAMDTFLVPMLHIQKAGYITSRDLASERKPFSEVWK